MSDYNFRTSIALKPNKSFMELEEEKENFSRAMTNIITTDLEVLEPEEMERSESAIKWETRVEIFWSLLINGAIAVFLSLIIYIYSTREFEPIPPPHVEYTPRETIFLKCAIHVDRDFLEGIWNTTEEMPPTLHSDYRETLTLGAITVEQLITNYTCEYWPEHKVMT
ncbi:Oidioi.mRNA.OKI2018_I69.chr1.g2802.t1.cds [Oikopleura dioica]|uniref:Oidioi.mRNA.OKI2018_I69.chr1.g2802.t1.cds n=1 Tax=Oikopleura dioica TaxID=34765 RepID=A0ABN7T1C6_OIKDI|nr:Oidioi.mRNA.OKI2018_I69.chr1.g2802.t1.cds [Oikopleura dioica]